MAFEVNTLFLLTIDVEDWFQVENLRPWMPFSTWDSRELRVEANVHKLLDLFDGHRLGEKTDGPLPQCIHGPVDSRHEVYRNMPQPRMRIHPGFFVRHPARPGYRSKKIMFLT